MKTVILTHADCDGMCSGAIALSKFPDAEVFFTKPVSFLSDLIHTDAERIIICDIAITGKNAKEISKALKEKSGKCEILYFDHHPLPESIEEKDIRVSQYIHRLNVSASELVYRHFEKDIPRERVWIALYGAIGDYEDDTPFAKERLANWDRRALYFEVSTIIMGIKESGFDNYDAKRMIVKTMAEGKNPSSVPGLVDAARVAVAREFELYEYVKAHAEKRGNVGVIANLPHFGFRGAAALFAATVTYTPVGLCIYEKNEYIDITMRKRNSSIPLNTVIDEAAEAVGGSGGGLPDAAGARIPKGMLDRFLKQLEMRMKKYS